MHQLRDALKVRGGSASKLEAEPPRTKKYMHDLHEANKILKLVLEKAKDGKLKKVNKIVIELGQIIEHKQTITSENLRFNLEMLSKETIAKDAVIVIDDSKNDCWKLVEIEGE